MSQRQNITGETADPAIRQTTRSALEPSLSLEELAAQQKVTPVSDLDELGSLWPADDDPDRLLFFIISERRARRDRADQSR